jgi:hypoxanthine phosphoribosyltransferase
MNILATHSLELFLSREKILELCKKIADRINEDYSFLQTTYYSKEKKPDLIALCILKGCIFFLADVARFIKIPLLIDFVKLSSYGNSTQSKGTVSILQDITVDVTNKHIILFDEIVDTGRTLDFYITRLKAANPASIKICALIDKEEYRVIEHHVDYVGIKAGPEFLVGYGLDYAEHFRNLPEIYQLVKK